MKKRVGILISGRGSNMMALVEAARARLSGRDRRRHLQQAGCGGARGQGAGCRRESIDHKAFASREAFDAAVHAALSATAWTWSATPASCASSRAAFVARWKGRQLNIHPSLLPLFKGLHPHRQALDAGVKISGCTVHFVTPEIDSGPIVAQAAVPVLAGDTPDTLAERILLAEHRLYPHALALVAGGEAKLEDGRVVAAELPLTAGAVSSPPTRSARLTAATPSCEKHSPQEPEAGQASQRRDATRRVNPLREFNSGKA